jgi:hypothetical protein
MSLPIDWVEKIFTKLTLIYGRDFVGRWDGLKLSDVKTDWAHELQGFRNYPEAIGYALQNMPTNKPPTVLEFKAIARKAPMPEMKQLPEPKADAQRVAAELVKLSNIRKEARAIDHKAWARRILERAEKGEKVRPICIRFAREALGNREAA